MRVAASLFRRKSAGGWNLGPTRSTSVRLRERARIVLMAAQGMTNIAAELEVDARLAAGGLVLRKRGRRALRRNARVDRITSGKNTKKQAQFEVVEATTQTTPNDATHWSCRSMARHLNTTHSFEPGVARPLKAPDSHLQAQQ